MTATKGGLVPVLSPLGHLTLVPEADAPSIPPEVSRRRQEAFTRGAGHGLWALGAGEVVGVDDTKARSGGRPHFPPTGLKSRSW